MPGIDVFRVADRSTEEERHDHRTAGDTGANTGA
jgi:hypothetical protein